MHIHCVWVIFQKILQVITWKKTGLYGYVHDFSVDYNGINADILDILKYLMKKCDTK